MIQSADGNCCTKIDTSFIQNNPTLWVSVKSPLATDPLGCGELLQGTITHSSAILETASLDFMCSFIY